MGMGCGIVQHRHPILSPGNVAQAAPEVNEVRRLIRSGKWEAEVEDGST